MPLNQPPMNVITQKISANWHMETTHTQLISSALYLRSLQWFDTVGWATGRASGL